MKGRLEVDTTDFVVIGSGIAGLYTALQLAEQGDVTVLCKKGALVSNTWYAQGGIAAAYGSQDSPELHFEDTLEGGCRFGDPRVIKIMAEEGPQRIRELQSMGIEFDHEGEELALGREGAHSRNRILRIGGDATGRFLIESLFHLARDNSRIHFHEDSYVLDLITEGTGCKGVRWTGGGRLHDCFCKAVILATGGGGYLYWHTTNPETATGDGLALAYRAGAGLRDLEFIQFHPTVFFLSDTKAFLISEAVRGEGAYLVNSRGERFMSEYHPMEELGPRDVVARAIVMEMKRTGDKVFLDLRHLGEKFIQGRFPTIYNTCREWGIHITGEKIPVVPAAHYFIGGVRVDRDGFTGINNLYAVGEVASTGVHGANRLASNSLLEALVFGKRVADAVSGLKAKNGTTLKGLPEEYSVTVKNHDPARLKESLRKLMWEKVGLFRTGEGLGGFVARVDEWMNSFNDHNGIPGNREVQNMLLIARLIGEAALQRKESRGCHFRADYPEVSSDRGEYHLLFQRDNRFKGVAESCALPQN